MRPVQYRTAGETTTLTYEKRELSLKYDSSAATLLELLVRKGFLEKGLIVKGIYGRDYESERDDKLVYYHIHSLRKRLETIGLPPDAIRSEGDGYRFVPEVETVEGEKAWS
jgi:DNA-binding response OmpR family regulator